MLKASRRRGRRGDRSNKQRRGGITGVDGAKEADTQSRCEKATER